MMRRVLIIAAAALALAACKPKDEHAQENLSAAAAFMAQNATKPGIKTLPSGVQYEVVKSGPAGGVNPKPGDEVKVHYEGKLTTGEVFDSSYERGVPASMTLEALIPAWMEAMPKMKPGDEWMLYIPPEQGYGENGAGPIPPNSALIFRVELIDVLPAS